LNPDKVSDLLAAERDIEARLEGQPIDFASNRAISNIYRAAAAVRRRAEQGALADFGLSWGGFTILWVLWIWGEMPTARLAQECDLAKGTLTGMLSTLEKNGLVVRTRCRGDKRRVLVRASELGCKTINELFPRFNSFEVDMVDGLTPDESTELSRLLRIVINNAG
jgi:DNA-binding MarR family transcriptional regulator